MKLHRPVAEQVVSALCQTFGATEDGRSFHADKVIERLFKNNRKLGSRDRKFVAEATYDIVRWWRLLWAAVGEDKPILEARAIWRVLGAWLLLHGHNELPDWPELRGLTRTMLEKNRAAVHNNPAVRESLPDWIYELGHKELGAKWDEILPELNRQAPVILRANRLKITRDELQSELRREDVETVFAPETNDGLILTERRNVFQTECFKLGYFEVQDGASQQASPLVRPEPGQRVIDGCAGAGGKTLHLAALMRNKGKIISTDIHQRKLEELRKRCTRAGVDICETRLIDGSKTIKRMEKTADRVLLDVPCTGLGVLRRNPDTKWKLKPEDVTSLLATQAEILATYSEMLKPGGRLVYSTCSILPSENSEQVKNFLASREGRWRFVEEHQYWPGVHGYDGFYAAALERLT